MTKTISPFTLTRSRLSEEAYSAPSSVEAFRTSLPLSPANARKPTVPSSEGRKTVGVWDLGAWVGGLPQIIKLLNTAQNVLLFFEAQAAIPAGITSRKQRVVQWSEATLKRKLKPREKQELTNAIIDVEFFDFAKPVRKDLGVDYLIGLSPDSIAGEENDQDGHVVHSDFFSSSEGRISIVSTVDLRKFADKANRSFEFAIGYILTGVMFLELNRSRIGFHEKNRGCLMDYNYDRAGIADCLAQPAICEECASLSKPEFLEMARVMLRKLEKYPRPRPQ